MSKIVRRPALLLLMLTAPLLFASPLAAQRGAGAGGRQGRQQQQLPPDPTPPAAQSATKADTGMIRKTPTGYVLDFQNQDLQVVLSAVAEAGNLNITFSNMPQKRVTLRTAKAMSHDDWIDVVKGLAESNGLKYSQTGDFIRIEGVAPVTVQQLQQQQQQAQAFFAAQNQLRLYTYRLKHVSATTIAPVLMNLIIGTGISRPGAQTITTNGATVFTIPQAIQGPGGRGGRGGGGGGGGINFGVGGGNAGGAAQQLQQLAAITDAIAVAGQAGNNANQAIQQRLQGLLGGQLQGTTQAPSAPGTLSAAANDIRIVAEESTNSLMIRATAQDYQILQGLIQTVDLRPLQVLIEVTIAEVQRNKDLNVGISGTASKHSGTRDTAGVSFPTAATARDFVAMLTGAKGSVNYDVAINALQTRGEVRVLSMPVIIAQNNKEAILNVGEQRPFVQVSQTVANDPTGRVQTIQYVNVGKTLTITPTINADGYVNMAVKQTDNNATNEVQFDAPVISQREATTQVFLRNGQTTVIGGLADNDNRKTVSGIPFLSRIPIIGSWLFGNTQATHNTSELFLFLTPHIISEDADIDRLRDAVKSGSELLQDMPTEARIKMAQPAPTIVIPRDTTPPKPPTRGTTDSTRRRPPPSGDPVGDSATKVVIPIKKG
ncbi:MAG: secretin N-terminal domain-containing protein [Gemmatimonadaceae bacterium]